MKIFILFSILLMELFSYQIEMEHSFEREIAPKEFGVNISISTKADDLQTVLNKLTDYSDFIKSFKSDNLLIQGGTFNTSPNYIYKNNHKIKSGYIGNIHFKINSKNSKEVDDLISMVNAKNTFHEVEISISSNSFEIDKEESEKIKEELKLDAINWSKNFAKKLSNKLDEVCFVKNINFNYQDFYTPSMYQNIKINIQISVPKPIKKRKKVTLYANFLFECK